MDRVNNIGIAMEHIALSRVHRDYVMGGYVAFGVLSFIGFQAIRSAIRDDFMGEGVDNAVTRIVYMIFGLLLQVPFVAYFLWVRSLSAN